MLLTKTITIKWSHTNKKYFIDKGYKFTKYDDEFECSVLDVHKSSDRIIECECDYCHEKFNKSIKKYYFGMTNLDKDCCNNCRKIKSKEIRIKMYGTLNPLVTENGKIAFQKRKEENSHRIWTQVQKIFKENNYQLISEKYETNDKPIYYICNKHKDKGVQKITWVHLQNGEGCSECGKESSGNKQRYSYDYVKNKIEENYNEHFCKLISNFYTGYNDRNLEIMCECGDTFITSFALFTQGKKKCTNCNSSIGEQKVNHYLKENNYYYIREYRIKPDKYKNYLYYDFYLPQLKVAIEFDGIQHFEPTVFEGTDDVNKQFELQQYRDNIKNNYSLQNDINLIRIPYWNIKNIDDILDTELDKYKKQKIN